MEEIRKDIKGYEGYYQVSNFGRVKSLEMKVRYARHKKEQYRITKEKIRILTKNTNGYLRVELRLGTKQKLATVHRLVAEAFIPNPNNKPTVNHKDGCKQNNNVSNLEWNTYSENIFHSFDNLLNKNRKPIYQIKNGKIIKEYNSASECQRQTGFSVQVIGRVALGKRKSAYGYQWKYKEKD